MSIKYDYSEKRFEIEREIYFQGKKNALIKQLIFAKRNVPFYKEKLKHSELKFIKNYRDFHELIPIVDSSDFVKKPEFFTSNLPIAFVRGSSSTSGSPKKIFLTKHDLRHWAKAGRLTKTPYFKRGMTVTHSKRKERYYLSNLDESIKKSGGNIILFDPKNKSELLECIGKSDLIMDYAEMIYYISKQLSSLSGINLNKRLITSYTGNKLSEEDIKGIKENFASIGVTVDIYSEYGTSETGPIGYAPEDKPFKIIYSDNVFIEVIDSQNGLPARDGEIIVTALNRTGSVFIRYRIGDNGKIFFKGGIPYFNLKGRSTGFKVASVFFSPQYVFNIIRNALKVPVFCDIRLRKGKTSYIKIVILIEKGIHSKEKKKVEEELINKMNFDGDMGSTVNIDMLYQIKKFNEKEIRKGYAFSL